MQVNVQDSPPTIEQAYFGKTSRIWAKQSSRNHKLICEACNVVACSLLCEFPPTGGAVTSWNIRSHKLLRYITTMDYFVLTCECLFILFILYYIIEEVLEVIASAFFVSFFFCESRHTRSDVTSGCPSGVRRSERVSRI